MGGEASKYGDWRLQAHSTITQPYMDPNTGHVFPVGSEVMLHSIVKWGSERLLSLAVPNAVALFLNLSREAFNRSSKLLGDEDRLDTKGKVTIFLEPRDAIDWIEGRVASVVFACAALEAFANEMLPEDFVFNAVRNDQRCTESYSKPQIERFLPLDTKLGKVLPCALACPSPREEKLWEKYKRLRKMRDRTVHMKSADRLDSGPEVDTVWNALSSIEVPHRTAKGVIDFFLERLDRKPHWATHYSE